MVYMDGNSMASNFIAGTSGRLERQRHHTLVRLNLDYRLPLVGTSAGARHSDSGGVQCRIGLLRTTEDIDGLLLWHEIGDVRPGAEQRARTDRLIAERVAEAGDGQPAPRECTLHLNASGWLTMIMC